MKNPKLLYPWLSRRFKPLLFRKILTTFAPLFIGAAMALNAVINVVNAFFCMLGANVGGGVLVTAKAGVAG